MDKSNSSSSILYVIFIFCLILYGLLNIYLHIHTLADCWFRFDLKKWKMETTEGGRGRKGRKMRKKLEEKESSFISRGAGPREMEKSRINKPETKQSRREEERGFTMPRKNDGKVHFEEEREGGG